MLCSECGSISIKGYKGTGLTFPMVLDPKSNTVTIKPVKIGGWSRVMIEMCTVKAATEANYLLGFFKQIRSGVDPVDEFYKCDKVLYCNEDPAPDVRSDEVFHRDLKDFMNLLAIFAKYQLQKNAERRVKTPEVELLPKGSYSVVYSPLPSVSVEVVQLKGSLVNSIISPKVVSTLIMNVSLPNSDLNRSDKILTSIHTLQTQYARGKFCIKLQNSSSCSSLRRGKKFYYVCFRSKRLGRASIYKMKKFHIACRKRPPDKPRWLGSMKQKGHAAWKRIPDVSIFSRKSSVKWQLKSLHNQLSRRTFQSSWNLKRPPKICPKRIGLFKPMAPFFFPAELEFDRWLRKRRKKF